MAESVGKLAVLLTTDTAGMSAGLAKGKAELGSFKQFASGIGGNLMSGFSMGAGMKAFDVIMAGAKMAARFIADVAAEARQLTAEASRLGIGTTTLQQYGEAAEDAGLEINAISGALDRMRDKIAEAANGNKEAAESFRKINLDPEALAKMAPDAQFQAVAEHITSIGDGLTRAKAEMDIFGKSGAQLEVSLRSIASGSAANELVVSESAIKNLAAAKQVAMDIGQVLKVGFTEAAGVLIAPFAEIGRNLLDLMFGDDEGKKKNALEDQAKAAEKRRLEEEKSLALAEDYLSALEAQDEALATGEKLMSDWFAAAGEVSQPRSAQEKAFEKFLTDNKDNLSADDEQMLRERATQATQAMAAAKERAEAEKAAAAAIKENQTAEEKYLAAAKEATRLRGLGVIDAATEARIMAKSQKELLSAWRTDPSPKGSVGALERGSSEAYQAIAEARAGQTAQQEQVRRLAAIEELNRESVVLLHDIRTNGSNVVVAGYGV